MKKLEERKVRESANWDYKGYELIKTNGYWYAFKDGVTYVAGGEPTETRQELVDAIDEDNLMEW